MTLPYLYGLLDPRPSPAAKQANTMLLGPQTLGIEVTDPNLAAGCGLGNIDPQHRPDGGAVAAIEAAIDWPLPPPQSRLVTIRPDADAFGAMAVLGLRAARFPIDAATRERIDQIARADCFDNGNWPGRRGPPARIGDIDEVGPGEQYLGALIGGLGDRTLSADRAVAMTRGWIVSGVVPDGWDERATQAAEALFLALRDGRVHLHDAMPGRIAIVKGCVPGAMRLGYRLAPVVLAVSESPAPWRKITVAQWRTGHVDLVRAARLLSLNEPGWGGAPGIVGSPQGRPCRSTIPDVLAVLLACGA